MDGAGAPATAGLTESGRPALVAGRVSSTCADGVCVSTLRVQLSRVTSGMGARCPSGISCAWQNTARHKVDFPLTPNPPTRGTWPYHLPNHSKYSDSEFAAELTGPIPARRRNILVFSKCSMRQRINIFRKKAGCNSWCIQIIQ